MPLRNALAADDAIDALVELSREVANAADPAAIPRLLVEAAARHLAAEVVAVYRTSEDGGAALAEIHGRPREALDGQEPGFGVDLPVVVTLPLVSSGDLFGTLVLGWRAEPGPYTDRLASGLTDIAATALDRAHRTRELMDTIRALEESRHELARTESLRHLGQMAAVVAHEVKNPLASIGGVLQILRGRAKAGPDHDILGKVLGRLDELDRLVDELLQFSRPREPVREPVALDAFVHDVAALFRQDAAAREVELDLRLEPATVRLDRGMIQRVLLNLLLNAAQAMDGKGRIEVTTAMVAGGTARITVTDLGPGIPPDLRERVFDPFYTTKVRGTGLGLPVARQVVASHGGTLAVEDGPGTGARLVLKLPVA